jgi:hypothetical protein
MPERNENMIAGLLTERAGYEARDLPDRVALVDEQLEHYGYREAAEQRAAASQGEAEPPKRRGRAPKQTAEQQAEQQAS